MHPKLKLLVSQFIGVGKSNPPIPSYYVVKAISDHFSFARIGPVP